MAEASGLQGNNGTQSTTLSNSELDNMTNQLLNPKRIDNETFEQYKERRKYANKAIKKYLKR